MTHTPEELAEMLASVGVASIDDLFDDVPPVDRVGDLDAVPAALSELEVTRLMHARAAQDGEPLCFIGAGAYSHHIPAAVWQVASRGEFASAYPPEHCEAVQGTLQVIYEFQSMLTALTAMEVASTGYDDGAGAFIAALQMAAARGSASRGSASGPARILIPRSVPPHYRNAAQTFLKFQNLKIEELPFSPEGGHTDLEKFDCDAQDGFAVLVIPQPNFFGVLEDVHGLTNWAHGRGASVVALINPLTLGVLCPPGEWGEQGADIAAGDCQPLGLPLASGGPYPGFLCTKRENLHKLSGQLVAHTRDSDGKSGFVSLPGLVSSGEPFVGASRSGVSAMPGFGLEVIAASVYLSLVGADGLKRIAETCHDNTRALVARLTASEGVGRRFPSVFFHEAVIALDNLSVTDLLRSLAAHNVLGGYPLGRRYPELENCLLVCATEVHTQDDLDAYDRLVGRIVALQSRAPCPVQPKI